MGSALRNGRARAGAMVFVLLITMLTAITGHDRRAHADPAPRAGDCVTDGSVQTGAIFNNPHTDDNDRIHRHMGCLIKGAPEGAKVNLAGYHFADETITAAVIDAIGRGVEVSILLDGKVADKDDEDYDDDREDVAEVREAIQQANNGKSAVTICPASNDNDDACLGSRRMHNKLLTLSQTHGTKNVTFLTSSNFEDNEGDGQEHNSGLGMWNSGYTAADDQDLYGWFADTYFPDLVQGREDLGYYENQRDLQKPFGKYRVFHSPRSQGSTALEALDKVECLDDTGGTDPSKPTTIRVAMWSISSTGGYGTKIAERLWELDNDGCDVDIVADSIGYDTDNPSANGALKTLLQQPQRTAAGKDGNYHGPEVRTFYSKLDHGLHEKNMMIDGRYDGKSDQKVVFTGSYNFTQSSAAPSDQVTALNDETWMQIDDPGVHDQFVQNFLQVKDAAPLCWQTATFDGCEGGRSPSEPDGGDMDCHETADAYGEQHQLYLYRGTYCKGGNDGRTDESDSDYGNGKGPIKKLDNEVDSIVNTTTQHIKFYNYPGYNAGHPEADSFCVRLGAWVNQLSRFGDGHGSWSNSISGHRIVDNPKKDCDRWFGGYREPNR